MAFYMASVVREVRVVPRSPHGIQSPGPAVRHRSPFGLALAALGLAIARINGSEAVCALSTLESLGHHLLLKRLWARGVSWSCRT